MQWESLSAFLDMGGYGLYVWGSYAATFILIAAELILLRRGQKQNLQRLKRMRNWEAQ